MKEYLPLFGRFGLTLILIVNGLHKALEFSDFLLILESKGLPFSKIPLILAILIELIGGLAIVIGYKTKETASIVAVYLIVVTIFIHPIWQDMSFFSDFVKNLAIIGGFVLLAHYGAGSKSIDTNH